MAIKSPKVSSCEVAECAYNRNGECHAMAITIGGEGCPMCDTYFVSEEEGGFNEIKGSVGACHQEDCRYNDALECIAKNISVGMHGDHAECLTYESVEEIGEEEYEEELEEV